MVIYDDITIIHIADISSSAVNGGFKRWIAGYGESIIVNRHGCLLVYFFVYYAICDLVIFRLFICRLIVAQPLSMTCKSFALFGMGLQMIFTQVLPCPTLLTMR